jgi:hypothetical protein|tara:strand:+ start:147 stop:263 length:117 start_codon:yes stop_codon:yes gene_type:complete
MYGLEGIELVVVLEVVLSWVFWVFVKQLLNALVSKKAM